MAFSVATVESALRYWLTASTGLTDGLVFFHNQSGSNPASFMTLRLALLEPVSLHDEVAYRNHPTPTEGAELQRRIFGPRVLGVYVQAHTRSVYGTGSAFELVRKAQLGLQLPGVRKRLAEAGLAAADLGVPRNVATLLDTNYQSRYALDVRFNATDEAVTSLTYIETVSGAGSVGGDSFPFEMTAED